MVDSLNQLKVKVVPAVDTPSLRGGFTLHAELHAPAVCPPRRRRGVVDGEGDVVLLALVERVRGQLHRLPLRAVLQLEGQRVLRVELLATPLETKKGKLYI